MGVVCGQLLRSTRPPAGSEAELEELATRAGQPGAAQVAGAEVRRLQRARMALHRCARLCSLHFGPALLLAVLGDFVVMTCSAYWLIVLTPQADKSVEVVVNMYALTTVLCRHLLVCWVCSSAAERTDRAGLLLSRLQPLLRPGPALDVLQLPVDRLRVSAMGFCHINLQTFATTVSAAVTYLVILVQFHK
ncbi:gustatory receptor 23a-like [Schistocerca serialis cubense]|uniref:gustatory receptor 23a-like n=1 Tax=Schistocerca serialis cubense TaxID=2023355 RepID=UPI00214E850A|nr:gustatory receptor 23a-like [Schistocerca serialis cubense]